MRRALGAAIAAKASIPSLGGNPNDNAHLTIEGMITTLIINVFVFAVLMLTFESNRFYRQIYLKRLQNRFRAAERVPPYPPETSFGWLFEIYKVSEAEVLRMVGLDAYMCLRFIIICFKLSIFLTFWGLIVLIPVYESAAPYDAEKQNLWDHYSISNLSLGPRIVKYRLWITSLLSYAFAAYFCQLLNTEYNRFSIRRLQWLVQSDGSESNNRDPDTPVQTAYTVMIERIPGDLRSAEKLREHFERIFPGQVYHVEIALDLKQLDSLNAKRKRLRDKLEKAIAHYEATDQRPETYVHTGVYDYSDIEEGIFGDDGILEFIWKSIQPEKFGYSNVDALEYYTEKLVFYNEKVKALQAKYMEESRRADDQLLNKFKNRFDTRAAELMESITYHAAKGIQNLAQGDSVYGNAAKNAAGSNANGSTSHIGELKQKPVLGLATPPPPGAPSHHDPSGTMSPKVHHRAKKVLQGFRIEQLIFGASSENNEVEAQPKSFDDALHQEMKQLENAANAEAKECRRIAKRQEKRLLRNQQKSSSLGLSPIEEGSRESSFFHNSPAEKQLFVDNDDKLEQNEEKKSHLEFKNNFALDHNVIEAEYKDDDNDEEEKITPVGFDLLTQDPTIVEMIKKAGIDFIGEEKFISRKRSESIMNAYEIYQRDTQAEMRDFLHKEKLIPGLLGASSHGTPNRSSHGMPMSPSSQHGTSPRGSMVRGSSFKNEEMNRAKQLSDVTRSLLASSPPFAAPQLEYDHNNHVSIESIDSVSDDNDDDSDDEEKQGLNNASNVPANMNGSVQRTAGGGISMSLPINLMSPEELNEVAKLSADRARQGMRQGWIQTTLAGAGALRALLEIERALEIIALGALHKYSSTAFVTFKSRVTASIAQQMLLSHDTMEINHAPNPRDVIWDNIAIPKSQVVMRNYLTDIGIVIGSIFWSSLVNNVNVLAGWLPFPVWQEQLASATIMLLLLLCLPFIFDFLARFYEGLKTESEIQNSIMTRYFYYQLINIYVTVGFSGSNLWSQLLQILSKPQTLVDVIGGRMPNISLFFTELLIVKIFTAIPLEMIRPFQLSTIHFIGNCMDRRKSTRRDLRTGAFYSWPMLYGWIYPQLMMVFMIMVTYAVITPVLSALSCVFFGCAYIMYKYQLLYVYINDYQSGGYMWYAVFNRSLISMEFASATLLGKHCLSLHH